MILNKNGIYVVDDTICVMEWLISMWASSTPRMLSIDFPGIAVVKKLMPLSESISVNLIETHAYRILSKTGMKVCNSDMTAEYTW